MEKKIFGKAAAILLLAAGATVIVTMFTDNGVERTDDAQVEQYISPMNVKVAGYIKEIRFTEHQFVHKGGHHSDNRRPRIRHRLEAGGGATDGRTQRTEGNR